MQLCRSSQLTFSPIHYFDWIVRVHDNGAMVRLVCLHPSAVVAIAHPLLRGVAALADDPTCRPNDLRNHLEVISGAIDEQNELWALSLANCNLKPSSLCKLFPKLMKLQNFKFIDLSHNQDLFESEPSAIGLLRRYVLLDSKCVPQLTCLLDTSQSWITCGDYI